MVRPDAYPQSRPHADDREAGTAHRKTVTDVLPGTAAGSLAGALGAAPQSDPNGTPGVTTILGGTTATVLLIGYLVVFVIVSLGLTARRDIAG